MNTLELNISDLTTQGLGIARREDGKVVMVRNALPGERVQASLLQEGKSFALAQCEQVLEPSGHRTTPPCPYFGVCGGCDLQHLNYPAQLQAKHKWFAQSLRALKPLPEIEVIASPLELGYRHRLRLHFKPEQGFGFFARQSNKLVKLNDCLLATQLIRQSMAALPALAGPELKEVELLAGDGRVYAQPVGLKKRDLQIAGISPHWPQDKPNFSQGITYYQSKGLVLQAWPGQFSQVNWEVNRLLIECLLNFVQPLVSQPGQPGQPGRALDLFSGNGNLSLPLALNGFKVLAVEGNQQACLCGTYQAKVNQLDCAFVNAPVHRFLSQPLGFKPDLLLLDPPHSGIKRLIPAISGLGARAICYVSCHPAAMARDLQGLTQAGYQLTRLALLDMFPQTGQMECLSLLEVIS